MQIDRNAIVIAFEDLGEYDTARRAATELPDRVDTVEDLHLFEQFGIDAANLTAPPRPPRTL